MSGAILRAVYAGAFLAVCAGTSPALAVSNDYCADYAQSAVEQYQQAASHPECQVIIQQNVLRWQGNYDNHYKGCKLFGRTACESEREFRRQALAQCAPNN
jgi:tRNA(Ile)-lysidine synthase TilS/MesJ